MVAQATQTSTSTVAATDPDWWRGAVIYQIYPRSFADSNGDGIGDLPGIADRLDHIAGLGVDAIWLSPFYVSPMEDFGYDVADYRDVDPMFGSLADFDRLISEAHARGLKVLIDLVISHTSDRHEWFAESRANRGNPRADWYVWADPKADGTPPNNWLSVFGGSAWEWDTRRRQYYLHNFLKSQPDLNFHNAEVQDAVLDVARFWLERGVDGFRLDTVNFYFHDKELKDNPPLSPGGIVTGMTLANPYSFQDHIHDKTQPENLAFLERLRALCDEYPAITLVGEIGSDHNPPATMAAYTKGRRRLHMAYTFDLLSETFSAAFIRRTVEDFEASVGTGWPSWSLSNHDVPRVISRWNLEADAERAAPLLVAMVTSLRGTPCLYQGEELGLTEADVPFEMLQDPYGRQFWPDYKGRDGCRTPMPWRADVPHAGFSAANPWLPVSADHARRSVGEQEHDPASALSRVRRFLAWRSGHEALKKGTIRFLDMPEPVLAFLREAGAERMLCAFNLGAEPVSAVLPAGLRPEGIEGHGFAGEAEGGSLRLAGYDALFARV
ncbi:alpha-glucosidase [Stappia sp. F7233]|uniref:Alpha-glucosidase n=1 Tax=Stappia albiluteola TaxID=2758565 RepID=A0A839AAH2_9HYPH|nr:alpha-glucosidase family protein [Stappia albiluteola]MBA5776038.1 alpha-glucosidase [Stappia albiluteola]